MKSPFSEGADALYDLHLSCYNLLKLIKDKEVPECFTLNFDVRGLEEVTEELHQLSDKMRFLSVGAELVETDKRYSIIDWKMEPISAKHKIYNINITGDLDIISMFENMCISRTEVENV